MEYVVVYNKIRNGKKETVKALDIECLRKFKKSEVFISKTSNNLILVSYKGFPIISATNIQVLYEAIKVVNIWKKD